MKKMLLIIITTSLFMFVLFCSCSININDLSSETIEETEINVLPDQKLPPNFTTDKIKNALLEYINYRLWLYPATIKDNLSDKSFDNYIGKSIDVEIRLYDDTSEYSIYAYTSIGKWLAVFDSKNEFVYCEGQVNEDEKHWPQNDEFEVIERYSITIPEPHKPNYGTSMRKDKMIYAVESAVKDFCEDGYKAAYKNHTEWENVEIYIVNFYEYATGAHAWLFKNDGSITEFPFVFVEENDEFKIHPLKGFSLKSIDNFSEFARHLLERDISDAVKHFKCNIK